MLNNLNISNIPEIISLTDLRYKTSLLLKNLLEEKKPLILVKRGKKIGLILPLIAGLGSLQPQQALKVRPRPLGAQKKIKRSLIYRDYLAKKLVL